MLTLSSPKKSPNSKGFSMTIEAPKIFTDDIDCYEWLAEIGFSQYAETFISNLSVGGNLLSRRRLGQIRLQDFSKMNITNFEHQKILREHIDHTLLFAFYSPVRRREVQKKFNIVVNPAISSTRRADTKASSMAYDLSNLKIDANSNPKRADHKTKIAPRRRRSFDNKVWESVSKSRNADAISLSTADAIRIGVANISEEKEETIKATNRRRRWTFGDESTDESVLKMNKATLYGNMALEYDMLQREMAILQEEHLNTFKNVIKCEKASILFINDVTKDLMLHTDNVWYRLPGRSGLAGWCAETGECLNIADAYSDHRFNKNVDLKTGFRTKSVLCEPVRDHRGGGNIIAVIQMLNKIGGGAFDQSDEDALASCTQRVADDISSRFKELLNAASKFAGNAIFIGERNGHGYEGSTLTAPTANSIAARVNKK